MLPVTNNYRSGTHPMSQPSASYFGYYAQQSHYPSQFSNTDFNSNIQQIMPSSADSIQSPWHNSSVYMPTPNYGHHPASILPQRSLHFDDYSLVYPSVHHGSTGSASSPGSNNALATSTSSTSSVNVGQTSPIPKIEISHLPNGSSMDSTTSPPCGPYYNEPYNCKVSPDFNGTVDEPQSPEDLDVKNPCILASVVRPQQARSPYEWMKKSYQNPAPIPSTADGAFGDIENSLKGKTRTKDKYRVVYSDTQRLELEKEFHFSRYITIRRKSEMAAKLGLSERQVKIWFQNRRAKERKQIKKRDEILQREKMENVVPPYHLANAYFQGNVH